MYVNAAATKRFPILAGEAIPMLQKWAAVFLQDMPGASVTVRFDTPYVCFRY